LRQVLDMQRSASVQTEARRARQPALLRLRRGSSPLPLWAFGRNDRDQVITVGSDPSCDWPICSAGVAPIELAFLFTGDSLFVQSARPNEGARLDGERLDDRWVPLRNGARIDVGTAAIDAYLQLASMEATKQAAAPRARRSSSRRQAYKPARRAQPRVDPQEPSMVVDLPEAIIDPCAQTQAYGRYESEAVAEVVIDHVQGTEQRTLRQGSHDPGVTKLSVPRASAARRGHLARQQPEPRAPDFHDLESGPVELPRLNEAQPNMQSPVPQAVLSQPTPPRGRTAAELTGNAWDIAGTEPVESVMPTEQLAEQEAPTKSRKKHLFYALGIAAAYGMWIVLLDHL
jgi:hypothetical protein